MARSAFKRFSYGAVDSLLRVALRVLPASPVSEHVALWWGYRYQPARGVVRLRSGALLQSNQADHLQLLLYYLGTFEHHCLRLLEPCLEAGGVFVDVGANIGLYSIEAAKIMKGGGQVISVEAAPEHAALLKRSLDLNEFKNVVVCETAVSNFHGNAVLARAAGENLGMFTLNSVQGVESYNVRVTTLDELIEAHGLQSLDLIKMDIEGSEYKALLGAEVSLARYCPTILIEINEAALRDAGVSAAQLVALLESAGYFGWRIQRNGSFKPIKANDLFDCEECIFIHRNRSQLLERLRLKLPMTTPSSPR